MFPPDQNWVRPQRSTPGSLSQQTVQLRRSVTPALGRSARGRPDGCPLPNGGRMDLRPQRTLGLHEDRVERRRRGDEQAVALGAAEADIGDHLGNVDLAEESAVRAVAMDAIAGALQMLPRTSSRKPSKSPGSQ